MWMLPKWNSDADLEKKWAKSVQLVRVSFFPSDFLQNPYFRDKQKKVSVECIYVLNNFNLNFNIIE